MAGKGTQNSIIRIEGGLLPANLLNQMQEQALPGQKAVDYRVPRGLTLRDEIGRYWRIAQAQWQHFQKQRERRDLSNPREAVEHWLLPLLTDVFGFSEITVYSRPRELGDREFPITHAAFSGNVPIVFCPPGDNSLDTADNRFGQDGRRRSPTGLVQEYLNASDEALWGLACDGHRLRVLRDNPSMTRPAYVEVDLATLFEEERLPDFRILWLLLHGSRFSPKDQQSELCWLEQWREKGEEQGERLLDKLREGVTEALIALGNGFLRHEQNSELRQTIDNGELSAPDYYQELLRLVYRLLFLLRAEARDLLHPSDADEAARQRYREGYSLDMLRQVCRHGRRYEHRYHDLWLSLGQTLSGLAGGQSLLGLPALGGLFDRHQCPHLDDALVDNAALLTAVRALTWHPSESAQTLVATDYANMDTEELGSVYEALLELVPRFQVRERPWRFGFVGIGDDESTAGNIRKLTGSYYTPDVLVQSLIDTALRPVIRQKLADNTEHPREALLSVRVVDPACGSGHFLLAATRTLARELAQLDAAGDEPTPAQFQHALREVVQHCIYGVDLNPMAVELCRAALWMEALEPGKPLSFLESHIQCGNALVGVFDPATVEDGIPDKAFTALEGDDKDLVKELKQLNKREARNLAVDLRLNTRQLAQIQTLPEESLADIEAKRARWREAQHSEEAERARLLEDIWTAAFFIPKTPEFKNRIPTNASLKAAHRGDMPPAVAQEIRQRAKQNRFLHWPLAFPEVFGQENVGFDVVLGNPPWEVSQLSEEEFFASRDPEVANLAGDARKQAIQALQENNGRLFDEFLVTKYALASSGNFYRNSGRFALTAHGKLNLYPLFSELALNLVATTGRAGIVVQTGIATDDSNKQFFQYISANKRLASLLDIENKDKLFKRVDSRYKFCLLTLANNIETAELLFYATNEEDIKNLARRIHLSPEDFSRINPNTLTTPTFRADKDAELTRKIYLRVPVFVRETEPVSNTWQVTFKQGLFNMTSGSHLFKDYEQLTDQGGHLEGNHFIVGDTRYLPLYEAKMVHHYDHRFATFETDGETTRDATLAEKQNPDYRPLPRYWVDEWQVVLRTADVPKTILDGIKKSDRNKLDEGLRAWLAGYCLQQGNNHQATEWLGQNVAEHNSTGSLFDDTKYTKAGQEALAQAEKHPLNAEEFAHWEAGYRQDGDQLRFVQDLLPERCPKYLLGFRDVCRSTDERTVIASAIPWTAVGNNFPLALLPVRSSARLVGALQANLTALVFDFIARHKVGGTHLNFFIIKQLPILPPEAYTETDLDYIVPRILELTYTNHDMAPFARDLGYDGDPFHWDPNRRHEIKCQLDAYYAHLYGLTREELRYILDPADAMGTDYPSVTFPGLKRKEIIEFGEYLTQRRILNEWDKLNKEQIN